MTEQEFLPKKLIPVAVLVVGIIILLISWNSITVTIEAGHGGVLFKRFSGGIELDKTYGEGFHVIAPWNKMYIYEVRQQEIGEDMNVLASNGLEIQVDVSTWYEPEFSKLGYLHAEIGTSYLQRIIIPSLRSAARSVVGRYTPEQIYSTKRDIIQDEILKKQKHYLKQNMYK